jgi:hypothetical protein
LALATLHQLADMSSSLWQQIFCPVSKRVMLPEVGSPWAPVKPWTCGHIVCAAFAIEDPTAPLEEQKPRRRVFHSALGDNQRCKVYSLCAGKTHFTPLAKVPAAEAMHTYLAAYFKRRQERYEISRAWVESLQAASEATGKGPRKKPRRENSPTGPSSENAPQASDGEGNMRHFNDSSDIYRKNFQA